MAAGSLSPRRRASLDSGYLVVFVLAVLPLDKITALMPEVLHLTRLHTGHGYIHAVWGAAELFRRQWMPRAGNGPAGRGRILKHNTACRRWPGGPGRSRRQQEGSLRRFRGCKRGKQQQRSEISQGSSWWQCLLLLYTYCRRAGLISMAQLTTEFDGDTIFFSVCPVDLPGPRHPAGVTDTTWEKGCSCPVQWGWTGLAVWLDGWMGE